MSKTISITIILLSCAWRCHPQERSSSYFTFSSLKELKECSHGIGKFPAESELACALDVTEITAAAKRYFTGPQIGALCIKRKKNVSVILKKTKKTEGTKNQELGR